MNAYNKRSVHHVSEYWIIFMVALIGLIVKLTNHHIYDNLPRGLSKSDLLQKPNAFIAERAWSDLKLLTNIGSRPTGSYSNEVLAVEVLKQELSRIKKLCHTNQFIELDTQVVSGSFWMEKNGFGVMSVYRDVQNVVAKLHGEPQNGKNSSLLLNCHFDTVPESPGASDDGSNCAVMLEILRVLSRQSQRLPNSIIFLFNGAEETGLQASHGFITKHRWAGDVKAFINLESVGSGGKEILFQASSHSAWLIELYGKVANFPSAQAAAEEIFTSGLIPSDTDFRIFQAFGNISGLDFAQYINGYRYHTKFDNMMYLSRKTLQHTGENILELTRAAAHNLHQTNRSRTTKKVFFDIFGIIFISYSVESATIINIITVLGSTLLPYFILCRSLTGLNQKYLRFEIYLGFLINGISFMTSNGLCYAIAYDLDASEKSMSWYNNTFLCIPLYCIVTAFVDTGFHKILNLRNKAPLSIGLRTQARIIGTCCFWSVLIITLTYFQIRLAYAIVLPLMVIAVTSVIIGLMNYQNTSRKWLYVYLVGQIFVLAWCLNIFQMILSVLIPTAGRAGGKKNPEIIIGAVCCCLTFLSISLLTPLILLIRKSKYFFVMLISGFIITRFYVVTYTNLGFPYNDHNSGYPTVQRHSISHTRRTLYDKDGNVRYTDSGFWILTLDRNSQKTIESLTMPEEPLTQERNILCKNELFCGLPLYNIKQLEVGGFWLPATPPSVRDNVSLILLSHTKTSPTRHQMKFSLKAETITSLHIRMKNNVKLVKWSFSDNIPPNTLYRNETIYVVMITYGLNAKEFNIHFDLETSQKNHAKALLDISLVHTKYEGHKDHSATFANMLRKLPKWTFVTSSVANLKSWTF